MYTINDDLSIYATRGDIVAFAVTADDKGTNHKFQPGDVVRIKIYGKKNAENVVLQKDFPVFEETEQVDIYLSEHDTKFGEVISKPTDYWYEVELNPFTDPQTIIGYDEDGAKVFKLFPEGDDIPEPPVDPEVVKVIDEALDLTSSRPVTNRAVARAVTKLEAAQNETANDLKEQSNTLSGSISELDSNLAVERARIDNLVASATAPVDADANYLEVADIRVGADGITYGSAGTAVRGQVSGIYNLLSNYNYAPMEKDSPIFTNISDQYVNGYHGVTSLDGYTISYFETVEPTKLYFEVDGDIGYLTMVVFNGGLSGTVANVYRDENLPLVDSPVEVAQGKTVAISHRNTNFRLCHNSLHLGFEASNQFNLSDRIKKEIGEPVISLTEALVESDAYLPVTSTHSVFTFVSGYVDKDGYHVVDAANPYDTYYFTATKDFDCYFERINSGYLSIAHFGSEFGKMFLARYRYFNSENNLPYAEKPLKVKKGQTIAISCNVGGTFKLFGNNNVFGVKLKDTVYLNESQTGAMNIEERHNIVRYEKSNGDSYSTERLFIYIPTYVGYVGYEFAHVVNASIKANNWRIIKAFSCDDNLAKRFNITNSGEWEMAIQIDGRAGFIGGSLHGDEVLGGITFIVDGVKKTLDELAEHSTFKTLRIAENTLMYDPADNVSMVATHGKEYIFTNEGLTLKQFVLWETEQNITTSYMTMLPILRGNDAYSDLQVSDTYYSDHDFMEYDISVANKSTAFAYRKGVRNVTIYSNKSGVCATVEIVKTPDTTGGGWFQVSDAATYNKLYFTCAGYINKHTTKIGERWETETHYGISVNNGADT